jgi:hypothetical protein
MPLLAACGLCGWPADVGGCRSVSAAVPTDDHVQRNDQQEDAEQAAKNVRVDASASESAQGGAEEEPERQEQPHLEIDVASTVVAKGGEEPDGRQQGRALRLVLREPEDVDEQRDEDLTAPDAKGPSDDPREEASSDEPHAPDAERHGRSGQHVC